MAMSFDELVPPPWMDKTFFEKVIRHHEKDVEAEVINFVITPGSNKAEHFASILFRCALTFSSKFHKNGNVSLIIKTMPHEEGFKKDMLEDAPVFKTEMKMYGEILPEIENLLKSIGDDGKLCPKLIYQSTQPVSVIVLEDVSVDGFNIIAVPSADFTISKAIFQRLAKFHAATCYLMHEKNFDFTDFNISIYTMEDNPFSGTALKESLVIFADEVATWPGYEEYVPKLHQLAENFLDRALKCYKPNKSGEGHSLLNHGDFHNRNLLVKKSLEDEIENMYFIDFQICVLGSPAIDLIYGLLFQTSTENYLNRRDELIYHYHKEFEKGLKCFGFTKPIPTLLDLQIELLRCGCLDVIMSIAFMVYSFIDPTKMDLMEILESGDTVTIKKELYKSPEYQSFIKKKLPKYLNNGFI